MGKTVIFDFDGTLADTFRVALGIFYEITGRGEIPRGEVDHLRSLTLIGAARSLNLPIWKAPLLLARGRRMLAARMEQVELFDGMPEAVRQLKAEGYAMHIISLNSEANIRKLLAMHHLEDVFDSIHGKARLHSKAHIISALRRRYKLAATDVVYVGDEIRDVHAAHRAGVSAIAVSWGYNNLHVLEHSRPEALVLAPDELPAAVRRLVG